MKDCRNNVIGKINPYTRNDPDASIQIAALPIDSVPEELVVIELPIQGQTYEVMIDSGAGLSVIDGETVNQMKIPVQPA